MSDFKKMGVKAFYQGEARAPLGNAALTVATKDLGTADIITALQEWLEGYDGAPFDLTEEMENDEERGPNCTYGPAVRRRVLGYLKEGHTVTQARRGFFPEMNKKTFASHVARWRTWEKEVDNVDRKPEARTKKKRGLTTSGEELRAIMDASRLPKDGAKAKLEN